MAELTINLDPRSRSRRTLEDIRHFLVIINRGTATLDGEPFQIDADEYIAALDELLPPGEYRRPSDAELAEG
jgi:hypothetical protein